MTNHQEKVVTHRPAVDSSESPPSIQNGDVPKISRACDSCHKRKIKCDAKQPQCNWCYHHQIPCTFTRTRRARKRGKQPGQKYDHLDERLARIEKILLQDKKGEPGLILDAISQPQISSPDEYQTGSSQNASPGIGADIETTHPLAAHALREVYFAGLNLGCFSSYNGIPIFSSRGQEWVESCTGDPVASQRLCSLGSHWQFQIGAPSSLLPTAMPKRQMVELPERAIVEECVTNYITFGLDLKFPILDTSLFEDTLDIAYDQARSPSSSAVIHAKTLIYSFLAFMTALKLQSRALADHDGDGWATEAQHLGREVVESPPTLDGLQAIVFLSLYKILSGDFASVEIFMSVASRLIFLSGGHIYSPEDAEDGQLLSSTLSRMIRAKSHLRKLFWICYINDKEICLRTGRPPSLQDSDCDLTFPDVQTQPGSGLAYPEVFVSEIRLSMIKSKVYSALYSVHGLRKSDPELLRSIRELDDELEQWRISLPDHLRPTVSYSQESSTAEIIDISAIIMRLEYHYCMAILHQASSRCRMWVENTNATMEGVSSSLELSLQASRSSLFYLHAARHALDEDSFWYIVFYPISAFMTIFCNILYNPLNPGIGEDLKLLEDAPILLRVALASNLPLERTIHLQKVEEFISLLGTLARCAVEKACRERSHPD